MRLQVTAGARPAAIAQEASAESVQKMSRAMGLRDLPLLKIRFARRCEHVVL